MARRKTGKRKKSGGPPPEGQGRPARKDNTKVYVRIGVACVGLVLLLVVVAVAGGGGDDDWVPPRSPKETREYDRHEPLPEIDVSKMAPEGHKNPDGSTPAAQLPPLPLVKSSNRMAVDLYRAVSAKVKGNFCLGPAGLSHALALSRAGARGDAGMAVDKLLGLPGEPMHTQVSARIAALQSRAGRCLKFDNDLWSHEGYGIDAGATALATKHYKAANQPMNFERHPAVAEAFVTWLAKRTDRQIDRFYREDDYRYGLRGPDSRAILASSSRFTGKLTRPMGERRRVPFRTAAGEEGGVDMIGRKGDVRTKTAEGVVLVELRFDGGAFSFIAVMSSSGAGLTGPESQLDAGAFKDWTDQMQMRDGALYVPELSIRGQPGLMRHVEEALTRGSLSGGLKAGADFSGLGRGLKLAGIRHQAALRIEGGAVHAACGSFVEVYEKTEQPPASRPAWKTPQPRVPDGRAEALPAAAVALDRPFVFVVIDRHSGMVLYIGRCVAP